MSIPAALFKAECLKLMDEVARTGRPIVITKHGKPVAQLAPVPAEPGTYFGHMKGAARLKGDIVAPIDERWSALSGDEDALLGAARKKTRKRSGSRKK
ncbi:MAG: type II toxin-antitoxin system Phd/YefM family antitoxin [Steroidobacteraceae bacterium]